MIRNVSTLHEEYEDHELIRDSTWKKYKRLITDEVSNGELNWNAEWNAD